MKFKYLIAALVVVVVAVVIVNSVSEPGVNDLKGEYKEVAFYRNENNTGPIVRVYAVTVSELNFEEMKQYGAFMPHTKYGSTKVYFFDKNKPFPTKLMPGEQNFDAKYKDHVLAKYEKDVMSQETFKKY